MAKSKARFLSELLGSTGLVKKSKSELAGADEVLDLDVIPSIPNSKLTNASISIAGHSTALGGSVSLNTGDISEHTNYPYFTNARARSAISATGSLSYNSTTGVMSFTMPAQNTSNITEGTNLYYTNARADARIAAASTSDLSEGTNLYYTDARADARVALIVDSAPGTLNTLNELAAALGDDANFSTTVTNSIATKLPLAGGALTGAVTTNSTFDGRNVSVDGAKLDGIEAGATADQTAAQILTAIKTVDGSGSGLDADLLDGANSSVFFKSPSNVSGWQNSNRNFSVRTGGSAVGLHMEESDGTFGFQLYGDSGSYGFLDAEWANWDIQKVVNGTFKVDEGSGLQRVWNAGNDGSGSGLDADLLDGNQASAFYTKGVETTSTTSLILEEDWSTGTYNGQFVIKGSYPSWETRGNSAQPYGWLHHQDSSGNYTLYSIAGYTGTSWTQRYSFNKDGTFRNGGLAGNVYYHQGNDGSGSGLDADLLDGQQGSYYTTAANLTGDFPSFVQIGDSATYGTNSGSWGARLNVTDNVHAKIEVGQDANSMLSHWYAHTGQDSIKFGTSSGHDVEFQRAGSTNLEIESGGVKFYSPIRRNSHHASGFLEGSYNNIGGNGAKSNPIYTIGSSYNPSDAALGNMYGIGFTDGAASFISGTGFSGWGMYVAADGDARVYLSGQYGTIASTGQHYVGSNVVWNAGNDGSGSGLDADLLDGMNATDTRAGNTIVMRQANGYMQAMYVNTTDDASSTSLGWLYGQRSNSDGYHRRFTAASIKTWGGFWASDNDGSGSGLDADLLDGKDHTNFGATLATYGTTAGSSGRIRCTAPFNTNSGHMFQVTVSLYGSYTCHTYVVSGYMYSTPNQWYEPKVIYTGTGNPDIVVGRDSSGKAYISIANGNYMGVRVHNMTRGYQTSVADTYDPWTITVNAATENSVTPAISKVWHSTNDGAGSGLDADLLDGNQASAFLTTSGKAADSNLLDGIDSTYFNRGDQGYGVMVGTSGWNMNDLFTTRNRAGFFDVWSGTNFPPSTTHVHGMQVRHNSGAHYGWQLAGQYGQNKLWHRQVSNNTWGSWNQQWGSGNDGSGSGLDADLLDGANAAESGGSTIHKLASNGYSQLNNWTSVGGTGLYSGTTNGAHWYPQTATSYGTWRIDGSRGGYSGIYLHNGGAVVIGMYDSGGNGGDYHEASGKWSHYWHRGNTCLAINASTTSSSYSLYVSGAIYATHNITAYSDRRVKENIVQIDGALEKVNKLTGVYYNKIDDEKKNKEIGFIAQDVNEVVPELVTYAEDVDQYGVKYGNTTALLVEAVKELTQQVKDLKQEIDKMKEKQ